MSVPVKLETASNVATIGVAMLLSAVLVKVYLIPASAPLPSARAELTAVVVGTRLNNQLLGIDWAKNGRTLVLAVSTTCHFCRESEPFYRRLQREVGQRVKMVAVLPQAEDEGAQYLKDAGISADSIRQVALSDIGIRGTPTLVLVDARGNVTGVWRGKLQPGQEEEVFRALRSAD
jgi:hypothetical protein